MTKRTKETTEAEVFQEKIIDSNIVNLQQERMSDYGISINLGRAIPNIEDGLKPIQRRVLLGFKESNNTHDKRFKKGASVVGYTISHYSPHGDGSIYDAAVRMSQEWVNLIPLVDYHGNNGSISGDSAAAMRYLEMRSSKIAEEFFKDLTPQTVPHIDNFDKTLKEPTYLPVTYPAVLINGCMGLGYGYSTDIPTFHPKSVYESLEKYVKDEITSDEIADILKISLPTGNIVINSSELPTALKTGYGRIVIRTRITREEEKNGIISLVISEAPYQTTTNQVLEKLKEAIVPNNDELKIASVKDLSNKGQIRIVIKLKREANPDAVEEFLYIHTPLQKTIKYNFNLVSDFSIKKFSIGEYFDSFLQMRYNVIISKFSNIISELLRRIHILEGLIKVCNNYDAVISIISNSQNKESACEEMISKFEFTRFQATAIIEMRLSSLTRDGKDRYQKEIDDKNSRINEINEIIQNNDRIVQIILDDCKNALTPFFNTPDNTEYTDILKQIQSDENFGVAKEEVILMVTQSNIIKRTSKEEYVTQRRGGKGKSKAAKLEDTITDVISINTHSKLGMFTNLGRMFMLNASVIPNNKNGRVLESFLDGLKPSEKVVRVIPLEKNNESSLVFITKNGLGKQTMLSEFLNSNRNGIIAIELREGEEIAKVLLANSTDKSLLVSTSVNKAANISLEEIPVYKRSTKGIRLVKLPEDGQVLDAYLLGEEVQPVVIISKEGYGKAIDSTEFSLLQRNVMGVTAFKADFGLNLVKCIPVNLDMVNPESEPSVLAVTNKGQTIRFNITDLPLVKRPTKGNRLINLETGDYVTSFTIIY